MKDQKRFAALALSAVMVFSMAGSVSAAQKVESKDDLAGATIGVQLGTTGDLDASEYEKDGSTVERYNKGSEAVQALKAGQIDCVIIDEQPAKAFVEKNDDLKILDDTFDAEEYAICIAKDNTDLTDEFNKAIEELKADGTIDTIISNYIGDETGEHPYVTPEGTEYPNGKLTMATNAQFEPYEYYDGDNVVGIDADIAAAIAEQLGMELKIEDMAFDSIIMAVNSGKADVGIAGMTVTEDRLENVNFSDPYATSSQVIIVTGDSEIGSSDDLSGKKIGVQLGTTGDILADDVEGATVERYNKGFEAVQALSQGKIDAVIIDRQPAQVFVDENEGLKILDEAFAEEEYAIAIAKDNTELLDKVNAALGELKESGKLDEIIGKYISAE